MLFPKGTKIVQFYRNFREFTGGHLKHWHYFDHVFYAPGYLPYIYFGGETVWDARNPWGHLRGAALGEPLGRPDVLFVEGVSDWPVVQALYGDVLPMPVINLIQHVRHGDPDDPRYGFLERRAVRICVSEAVRAALEETGRVNGPMVTIPCGIDPVELPSPLVQKPVEICIAALKNPELGRRLRQRLERAGHGVVLLEGRMSRFRFLEAVNRAQVCVFLPWPTEGFYLPALEGMALNTVVVCPDCVGNREFCVDGENCLMPVYGEEEIFGAIGRALRLSEGEREEMWRRGRETVQAHGLGRERRAFLDLLKNLEQVW